ncbi:MAG: hypothetical protein Q8Q31_00145 [Nanoarchaeota archaeon]|nr:hypothetical protein [Nanoarchaeota archaeon]
MVRKSNYIGELVAYIKKNLKKGYTSESLKWALVNQGHSKNEVEKALNQVDAELANEAPVLHTKPVIAYEVIEPKGVIVKKKSWWKKVFRQ